MSHGKKLVLVGAGSASFGPAMLIDIAYSKILEGSTVVLHDVNKEKLEIIFDIVQAENKILGDKFTIEREINRSSAFKDADFIISSIEVGDRCKLWIQDYDIPRKHGVNHVLGECGGPGGSLHAMRIIPPIIDIVNDAEKICPNAFFINFSNPMSRVCLAIKRSVEKLKWIGLCHQIGFMHDYLPKMFDDLFHTGNLDDLEGKEKDNRLKATDRNLKMKCCGLNHFGFLIGLENLKTGKDLMPEFNKRAIDFFEKNEDRFAFSRLTFEVYKRFDWFPYVGDNHLGEYLQFGAEFTKTQDSDDWVYGSGQGSEALNVLLQRYHKKLQKGRYPRKGILQYQGLGGGGERAIPIIEAIVEDKNSYEPAVNIPNDGIVDNLPQDLVLETSVTVNKDGVHGVKVGNLPKGIAALLRIEASVQDLCIEAIMNKSKEQAITCLAVDPNVGSFEKAEKIFDEILSIKEQRKYLDYLK